MMSPIIFLHDIFLLVTHNTDVHFLLRFIRSLDFLYFNFYLPLADGRVQAHTHKESLKLFQFQRKHEIKPRKMSRQCASGGRRKLYAITFVSERFDLCLFIFALAISSFPEHTKIMIMYYVFDI